MPELSEGDRIAPDGTPVGWLDYRLAVNKQGINSFLGYSLDSFVNTQEIIRVRVSNEVEAECLVVLAEKNGFVKGGFIEEDNINCVEFVPNEYEGVGQIFTWSGNNPDLTFESDYQQIKSWLTYHGESEDDECDRCGGSGKIPIRVITDYPNQKVAGNEPCPNCSDDSDNDDSDHIYGGYDRDEIIPGVENESNDPSEPRGEDEDLVSGLSEKPSYHLQIVVDYIRELEQELEDVREERDKWKTIADEMGNIQSVLEILSDDEGDGDID